MGNREALLEGAKKCLLEKGYDRTTVRDIASAADVSMAAIGYHYGSREALLQQALFSSFEDWDARLQATLSRVESGDGADRFESVWALLIENFQENEALWMATLELFLQARRSPELMELYRMGQPGALTAMAALATGTKEEDVSDQTARTTGAMQVALITGIMVQWLTNPDTAPDPATIGAGLRGIVGTIEP